MVNGDGTRSAGGKDQNGAAARLGAVIARERRAAGLTQQQLADLAAVSVGAVRDLEQGRTAQPRLATIDALALVLGVDLGQAAETAGWPLGNGPGPGPGPDAEPMAAGLWLGVLGPLTVWRNGIRADPGAGRQRAVLGLLAVHPGIALHRETIIDAVWGYQPPASAIAMVQSYVSRLRRLLGERVLVSDGISYRLAVSAGELDALEFARLAGLARGSAAAGNPAAACGWYDRALQLWRGEPLADVSALRGDPALTELGQQRTAMILDHADAAAAAGWPERVLAQLRELSARDPLDERVHARLMLTLAACGQQAAALSVFGQLRQRLDAELGITPGAELADAHLRILRGQYHPPGIPAADGAQAPRVSEQTGKRTREHDPHGSNAAPERQQDGAGEPARPAAPSALSPRTPARPRQLPMAVPQFTGRASELAYLSGLTQQVAGGAGTVVISAIGGMAGIGKTALAVQWAHRAAASFPDGQLYVNLRGFDLADPPATPSEVTRGFLDALGVPVGQIPAGLDAQAALYRSMTAGKRLLIVLDNAASEQQVRPLLPSSPECLVLVTSRHQLTGLAAAEGARLITLDVLTAADARTLLTEKLGADRAAADPAAVTEIAELCGHLPLALAVTAARAAARRRLSLTALAAELRDARTRLTALDTGDPAVSVRAVFSWSYAQLTPAAARIFRLLGLHPGPDISPPATASLAGFPASQAARGLAELARAHLVAEPLPGRYTMHDLLRAYAAERAEATDDEAGRRDAIGRMLDHYLHTASTAAHLLRAARDPITIEPPRPGVAAEQPADYQAAMSWFEAEHDVLLASVRLATVTAFYRHAWQLPWAMIDFLDRRGHWHDWLALLRTALVAATRLGDKAGQAVTHRLAASPCHRLGDYDGARSHVGASLRLYQELGDRLGEARCYQGLCMTDNQHGRIADWLLHSELALSLFQAAGHRHGQADVLHEMGWIHIRLGHPQQGLALCREALAVVRELGDRAGEAYTWSSLGHAEQQLGHLGDAAECHRQALALWQALGDLFAEAQTLIRLGDSYQAMRDQAAAREAWARALALLDDLQHPEAEEARARLGRVSS
jgi:DNA-binding SARP family transcriptional activator/transcriptional regulator with XRE-family HTH domain/tetratricopeptide (TPR) repeat protein